MSNTDQIEERRLTSNMSAALPQGFDNVNPEQIKSFREFLMSYNKLSEICFLDCAWDFTTRNIKTQEERCALNCTEKYLKMNQRISQRFQEYQMITNENMIAASQKIAGTQR